MKLKSKIVNVASDMGDVIDERNFSTITLFYPNSMRLISMTIKSKSMVPFMIKQEHLATMEVLHMLGFTVWSDKE